MTRKKNFYLFSFLLLSVCLLVFLFYPKKFSPALPKAESFNYFYFKALIEEFPFNVTQNHSFYREYLKVKNQKSDLINLRTFPAWENIGPNNIAGRTLCIAINPLDTSQLWLGSAGSGLWKSETGGMGQKAWAYVPIGFPVVSVSSIAIQNDNPKLMFIGTGEIYNDHGTDGGIHTRTLRGSRGMGILKSIDSGKTWKLVLDWTNIPNTSVWKIIINPEDSKIVYAATTKGVYKSVDSGYTWFVSLDLPMATDLLIDHSDPFILYAGIGGIGGSHYGVYKTKDGGDTWQPVNSSNDTLYQGRIMLANYKANPKKVYAVLSDKFRTISMLRSVNGFENFPFYIRIKDVCSYQGWYAKCLHIKDDDSSKIITGGVDLYLDTSGTGNQLFNLLSWRIKIHADMHDIISNPLDPNIIYIATDGGVYRSNNFAKSFFSCNDGYISAQYYTGNVSGYSDKLIGGLQDNKSAIYNGDINWTSIHLGDGCYNSFHPLDDSILYVASQYQNLYRSLNSGQDWIELLKPNAKAAFVAPFLVHTLNPLIIYSGGDQLLVSSNGGSNWISNDLLIPGEFIVSMETIKNDADQIYLSTLSPGTNQSSLYYSNNSGRTLVTKNLGIPDRFIRDIVINEKNPNTLFIALGGSGSPGIMASYDQALTWTFPDNKNLPDVPFHSVLIDPRDTNILYAACDLGLFISNNRGESWHSFNQHDFDVVPVYDIKYSKITKKLILFTHGYGVFQCPLPDLSIPTKTQQTNIINLIKGSELSQLFYDFKLLKNIYLYTTDGKSFVVSRNEIETGRLNLMPGIYLIHSTHQKLNGKRILILN